MPAAAHSRVAGLRGSRTLAAAGTASPAGVFDPAAWPGASLRGMFSLPESQMHAGLGECYFGIGHVNVGTSVPVLSLAYTKIVQADDGQMMELAPFCSTHICLMYEHTLRRVTLAGSDCCNATLPRSASSVGQLMSINYA